MNKLKPNISVYIVLAAYATVIFALIAVTLSIPKWIRNLEVNYALSAEEKINQVVMETAEAKMSEEIIALKAEYPMEVFIATNDTIIYTSIPDVSYNNLRELLQEEAVIFEAQGLIEGKTQAYSVWYSIYPPMLSFYVEEVVRFILIVIILAFVLLFIFNFIVQRSLFQPLKKVKSMMDTLENAQLEQLALQDDKQKDIVSVSVNRFAVNLRSKMKVVTRNYTELEQMLQLERERLSNMITVSRGLVHDLKTPLHQTLLQNEFLLKKLQAEEINIEDILTYNIEQMDESLKHVNETLNLLDADVEQMVEVRDYFDVTEIFHAIREGLRPTIEQKQLFLDAIIPDELFVNLNKVSVRLIIHNLLTNATNYAIEQSEITFSLYEEDGLLYIICENDTLAENVQRVQQSEELFSSITSNEQGNYVYSTGNGLYLTKELSNLLDGTYLLAIDENHITITISLPI